MDPSDPSLIDVYNAMKEVCAQFDLKAYRIDDIEPRDQITDAILNNIAAADLILADLSGERPNVYYEVGYAHALGKRPILQRSAGTRLHFDLSVHKVPEYKNITELKDSLRSRLEAILGRRPKHGPYAVD
jgi:nucleoside 2-deoxyribosyltransferase